MPIYEYQCSRCKNVFELLHKMDEDCKVVCPKCMAPARKMISATSFVLKGSGFYVNDYPSKSRKDGKRAEKGTSHCSLSLTSYGKPVPKYSISHEEIQESPYIHFVHFLKK